MLDGLTTPREPRFGCPTGNCTWPPFDNLGVCSTCDDATSEINRTCWGSQEISTSVLKGTHWVSCNHTFSGNGEFDPVVMRAAAEPNARSGFLTTTGTIFNSTFEFADHISNILRVSLLRVDQDNFGKELTGEDIVSELQTSLSPVAHTCTLTWCVKHYGPTSVTNGILDEPAPFQFPTPTDLRPFQMYFKQCQSGYKYIPINDTEQSDLQNESMTWPGEYTFIQGAYGQLESLGNGTVKSLLSNGTALPEEYLLPALMPRL